MPEPSKAEGPADADGDATRSALATVRDLLTRSLMLPSDLVRDTLDDAVRRGRITRDDAEDLVERLMQAGRQQTEDALTRLESIVGTARVPGERAKAIVRRPPGTDRVLREVDRVRRTAGLAPSLPIADYDDLTAAQVVSRLDELDASELRQLRDHEKRNANRKSVLAAVDKHLR